MRNSSHVRLLQAGKSVLVNPLLTAHAYAIKLVGAGYGRLMCSAYTPHKACLIHARQHGARYANAGDNLAQQQRNELFLGPPQAACMPKSRLQQLQWFPDVLMLQSYNMARRGRESDGGRESHALREPVSRSVGDSWLGGLDQARDRFSGRSRVDTR